METDHWNISANGTEYVRSVFLKLDDEKMNSGIYDGSVTALKGLGRMFYFIESAETSYKTTQQVPNFIQQVREKQEV